MARLGSVLKKCAASPGKQQKAKQAKIGGGGPKKGTRQGMSDRKSRGGARAPRDRRVQAMAEFLEQEEGINGASVAELFVDIQSFQDANEASAGGDGKTARALRPTAQPPTIANVVAKFHLGIGSTERPAVDLVSIVTRARNTEYNSRRNPGLIMRLRKPRATAVIFKSGKVNLLGVHNIASVRSAAKKVCGIVKRSDPEKHRNVYFNERNIQITNIQGKARVPYMVNLQKMYDENQSECEFDPEEFPGLRYYMMLSTGGAAAGPMRKVVLTVFRSGEINIVGAKSKDDFNLAFQKFEKVLKKYREGATQ